VNLPIWKMWLYFLISNGVLGASVMMMWKGTFPPPMQKMKAPKLLSTAIFVVGLTAFMVFGTQDLLQQTIALFLPK
jgi:polyferredoxin